MSLQQICLDHMTTHALLRCMVVYLKRSKNYPFGAGTIMHLCPVGALLGYLAIRPSVAGPHFLFHDDTTLSKPRLIAFLHQVLQEVGVGSSQYSRHTSFRIRASTTAAKLGMSDSLIKILGWWRSLALVRYI